MREQLELLKRYSDELQRRLEAPSADIYALERLAELTAQSMIDLAAMYLLAKRGEKPPTYRALLEEFGRAMGLDPQRLGAVAALRNLLVHRYYSLSPEKELEAFRELVGIVPEVIGAAETLLKDPCLEDAKRLGPVFERHDVEYAYLFGSTAKRGCGRDLDIAVKFRRPKSLWQLAELARDVEDFLGLPDGAADLVDLDDAPPT
ncbi:MAG: HepT-like ribonuclease domain-containing protein, partial [Thermoproteus sp.]